MMFDGLTLEQLGTLRDMVEDWVSEGFTTPSYTDAQYDIFEVLGLVKDRADGGYDTRRPGGRRSAQAIVS